MWWGSEEAEIRGQGSEISCAGLLAAEKGTQRMAGPIISGGRPILEALFLVAILVFFGLLIAAPQCLGPLAPLALRLLSR
jgi:hypothetical protein